MKRPLLILLLGLLLSAPLWAADKVYSLNLKEQEIEEAIQKALDSFLNRREYVIKVRLFGSDQVEASSPGVKKLQVKQNLEDALPGFELDDTASLPKITDVFGNTFFKVEKMRVDLIMHQAISPSVDKFIRETVPVVAELNVERGDLFNFIPILPKTMRNEPGEVIDGKTVKTSKNLEWAGLAWWVWLLALLALALLVGLVLMLRRMKSMNQEMAGLQANLDKEAQEGSKDFLEQTKQDYQQALKDRQKKQEERIGDALLREGNDKIMQDVLMALVGRQEWGQRLVEELGKDKKGLDKLAIFVHLVGPTTGRKLFAQAMGQERYLELEELADEADPTAKQEREVLREIQKLLFMKKLTEPEGNQDDPFTFMKDFSPMQVAFLVKEEPVKIKAIALSRLTSSQTAQVLARLPKEQRGPVFVQLGKMDEIPLELVEKVARNLAVKARQVPDAQTVDFDGVEQVIEVMQESDPAVRNDLLNNLRTQDKNLSEKVEQRFFLFDSLPVVPKDVLTQVVRSLPAEEVITALVGADKRLQEAVILCFPDKIRRTLVSALKSAKPQPEQIKAKRRLVVKAMQAMAAQGKVDLRQVQSAWAAQSSRAS